MGFGVLRFGIRGVNCGLLDVDVGLRLRGLLLGLWEFRVIVLGS